MAAVWACSGSEKSKASTAPATMARKPTRTARCVMSRPRWLSVAGIPNPALPYYQEYPRTA